MEHGGATYALRKGDVLLLPAVIGSCVFRPRGAVRLLEVAIPNGGLQLSDNEMPGGGGVLN